MNTIPKPMLYAHLVEEACQTLVAENTRGITISLDGGRYKRSVLTKITADLKTSMPFEHLSVRFEDSAAFSGLQVSDVLANSVFQMLGRSIHSETTVSLLKPLIASGLMVVRPVELLAIKPKWIRKIVSK